MKPERTAGAETDRARKHNWLARDIARDAAGKAGPLSGLTFYAKDLFAIAGETTRAGSAIFDDDEPAPRDAGLVASARQAGATMLGTTNMDPLAYGFVSNNPLYGLASNPHDPDRICGGSSGGSAAVVAAGLADFALGTDTSGSIRVPSAFCGVAGYKPSAGFLDNAGIQALSPTFDRPGLFARDVALLTKVARELGSAPLNEALQSSENTSRSPKVGLLGGYFTQQIEHPVKQAIDAFGGQLGAREGIEVGNAAAARAAAYILVAYEACQVHAKRLRQTPEKFDPETRQRLFAAFLITEEWRANAIRVQAGFSHRFTTLFDEFDFILAPCVPMLAPLKSHLSKLDPGQPPLRASLGLYTQPVSLVGCPVVSIPLQTDTGLPTAVQLIGPVGSDARLLDYAELLFR